MKRRRDTPDREAGRKGGLPLFMSSGIASIGFVCPHQPGVLMYQLIHILQLLVLSVIIVYSNVEAIPQGGAPPCGMYTVGGNDRQNQYLQ